MTKAQDRILVQEHLAHQAEPKPPLSASEKADLEARIKVALKEKDAVLVAHYYTDPDIQRLAEETGGCVADSLEMARFGNQHPASTVVVAGVRFMGETAKILNPEKKVLMPTLEQLARLMLVARQTSSPSSVISTRIAPSWFMPTPRCGESPGRLGGHLQLRPGHC